MVVGPEGQTSETTLSEYNRLLKTRLDANEAMLDDIQRSGSEEQRSEVKKNENWRSAHGALLDGSFAQDDHISPELAKVALTELVAFRALDYLQDQIEFELTNGVNEEGEEEFVLQPMQVNNHMGEWDDVKDIPNWPMGCITRMSAFNNNSEWDRMGQIMIHIVNVAETILRTSAGVTAYLEGEASFRDTVRLNLPAGEGPVRTEGDWFFLVPAVSIPRPCARSTGHRPMRARPGV
jgi:hypothetical protein